MSMPRTLEDHIVELYRRIEETDRRLQNKKRTGTIHEVDAKKGLARVKLGEDDQGKPYLSGWLPWKEMAMGDIRTHYPPSVGQQVNVVSENGDLTDAEIDTSLPSNKIKRPHDKEGEVVLDMHKGKYRGHIDKDGNQTEDHDGTYIIRTKGIVHINPPE